MRRSVQVLAPLLASTAVALLAGCHHTEMQRCVDENNQVVDPSFCKEPATGGGARPPYRPNGTTIFGHGTPFIVPHLYRYYYGGGGSYSPGSVVSGGSYSPLAGHSYSTTSGTARGGFGRSFSSSSSHSSGGGE